MTTRSLYPLEVVLAHVATCPRCASLLDASAETRDPDARAAFAVSLAYDLDRAGTTDGAVPAQAERQTRLYLVPRGTPQ